MRPLVDVLDAFWKSKVVQASFIWAWADDMFLVPGRGSEYGRHFTESHGVDRIYSKTDATGWRCALGSDRRMAQKETRVLHIKKLYSPILVTTTKLEIPSPSMLQIPVTNRYFLYQSFRTHSAVEDRGPGRIGERRRCSTEFGPY